MGVDERKIGLCKKTVFKRAKGPTGARRRRGRERGCVQPPIQPLLPPSPPLSCSVGPRAWLNRAINAERRQILIGSEGTKRKGREGRQRVHEPTTR